MSDETVLLLASKKCDQCLTTKDRIVNSRRAAGLIRECQENQTHFICHKGSITGKIVHCRGVHDLCPSQAFQFAQRMGIPIREVDPDDLEKDA